jgi:hypothetical protein
LRLKQSRKNPSNIQPETFSAGSLFRSATMEHFSAASGDCERARLPNVIPRTAVNAAASTMQSLGNRFERRAEALSLPAKPSGSQHPETQDFNLAERRLSSSLSVIFRTPFWLKSS